MSKKLAKRRRTPLALYLAALTITVAISHIEAKS